MPLKRTLITALLLFAVDRLSKWFVVEHLDLASRMQIDVLPSFITFTMAWNRGINFGLFTGEDDITRYILIAVAVVIIVFVLFWTRNKSGWLVPLSSGVLIWGALGNVYDRFAYGAVADFLNVTCCGINNPYAFNVADIAIFAGAFGLILFGDRKT